MLTFGIDFVLKIEYNFLFLELNLNTKQDSTKERTDLFLFIKCINKIYRKKPVNFRWEKISKAKEEYKLTVWEKGFYKNLILL